MNAITLPTPAELDITPRDRRFGREAGHAATLARRARRSDRNLQCAVDDLSRRARPSSSKACARSATARRRSLAEEIKAFTTQEAIHSREHDAFNKRACERRLRSVGARGAGREAAGSDQGQAADRQPRRDHGARAFHRDPRPPAARRPAASRRRGHGRRPNCGAGTRVEEIEHKGVAYDTWLHATRRLAAAQALEAEGAR